MKTYFQLIEATKPNKTQVLEINRLRKEAKEAYKAALKLPNLAKQTIEELKRGMNLLADNDWYASKAHAYGVDSKVLISYLKGVPKSINKELALNAYRLKEEKKDKKILDNPYTICDLLSNPKPNKFINMIKGDIPDLSTPWIKKLYKIMEAFGDWFDSQGGRKITMINIFNEMVACKNRAPWASWSGKGYRGVTRSTAVVSKYDFTGEVKKIGKNEWLVAKGTYKSGYGAQSWSDVWRTAEEFSTNNLAQVENPIAVVLEVNLKRSDTLLSPDVIKQISMYGKGSVAAEREVIRVGNNPIPVTIYVSANSMEDWDLVSRAGDRNYDAKMYVYDRAVVRLGVKGADAFAKTKVFRDLVKGYGG